MSFTDEDLKTLKADMANGGWPRQMLALMVRLEAAEEFGEMACLTYPEAEQTILYKAWRKAAGKDEVFEHADQVGADPAGAD